MKTQDVSSKCRVVLHGHLGRGNVGDEAMLRVIYNLLRSHIAECDVFVAYGSDTWPAPLPESEAHYFERSPRAIVRHLISSDAFVIAGGTHLTLFGSNTVGKLAGIIRQTMLILSAKLFGNKVLMLSVGIGPLESGLAKLIVKLTLKLVDFVSVRDDASLSMLTKLNYSGLYARCSDAAFFFRTDSTVSEREERLGVSVLPYFACHTNEPQHDVALAASFADTIRAWLELTPKGEVVLLPVCSQDGPHSDTGITQTILEEFSSDGRVSVADLHGNPSDFVERLNRLSHFIGMRYHSVLFANVLGLPTLNIAYHEKNHMLATDLGIPKEAVYSVEEVLRGDLVRTMPSFCAEPTRYISKGHGALHPEDSILPAHVLRALGFHG